MSNSPQHHHQHIPIRTPLVAYIKHAHERRLDMRIIRLLIGYGARVSFSRGRGLNKMTETERVLLLCFVFFR